MSDVSPSYQTPDWSRLQRALMVEAERGFNDLEGHQQRFSEFLQGELASPPEPLSEDMQGEWRSLNKSLNEAHSMGNSVELLQASRGLGREVFVGWLLQNTIAC